MRWRGDDRWPLVPGSPRRSRLVTPSDDLRAHHPAGCYSWVASRPDSAGSAGWSRREALALAGAGSQPPWELDLRRSLRLRQTSSPPRFQAERPGDHDGGEHYTCTLLGPEPRVTRSIVDRRVGRLDFGNFSFSKGLYFSVLFPVSFPLFSSFFTFRGVEAVKLPANCNPFLHQYIVAFGFLQYSL